MAEHQSMDTLSLDPGQGLSVLNYILHGFVNLRTQMPRQNFGIRYDHFLFYSFL